MNRVTYKNIQKDVLNRINTKEWEPGDLIPIKLMIDGV